MVEPSSSQPVQKDADMEEVDFVIDRNRIALTETVPPPNPLLPEISKDQKMEEQLTNIFTEIAADSGLATNNIDQVRRAASVKSYGCDTESEFEFSGGEDSEFEDFKTICDGAKDSDEEFDRLVSFSNRIIEKVHKAEYPDGETQNEKRSKRAGKSNKTKNVHEYDSLPPIEKLSIQCQSSLMEFGKVAKVVDCMVIVEPTTNVVLDFDSFLFDEKSHAIGQVYDIFGQVKNPNYVVRFNSSEEAALVAIGMKVFYAPNEEEFSKTPFKGLNIAAANREEIEKINKKLDDLERKKRAEEHVADVDSDVAFSDDESEMAYTQMMKGLNVNRGMSRKRDRRGGQQVRFGGNDSQPSRNLTNNRDQQNRRGNYFYRGRGGMRGQNAAPSPFQPQKVPVVADPNNPYAEFGVHIGYNTRQ